MRFRRPLTPYGQVARRSFQRFSTYRVATAAGAFTNIAFGFLRTYVLLAVFQHRATVGALDATDVVTYVWVTQGMLAAVLVFAEFPLAARIRTGDVVSDLYRPLGFQSYWLADDLGRIGYQLLARGIPPVLVGAAFLRLRLPHDPAVWLAFALSVALAALVSFAFRFLVSLSGFWLLDSRGPFQIGLVVASFFAGTVVPLDFFPGRLGRVAAVLPFSCILQLPIEVFLGKHAGLVATAAVLARQALWAGVLLAGAAMVGARAFRKVVIQGG